MKKIFIHALVFVKIISMASCQDLKKVEVAVTDEAGIPIKDVSTTITFLGTEKGGVNREKGVTNSNGLFKAEGVAELRMSAYAEKEGYYTSRSGRLSRKENHEVTFTLREKKKPIALYVKKLQIGAPVYNEDFGYDMLIGDWVAPYGKGKVNDFIFKASREKKDALFSSFEYDLSVSFSGVKDGFVTVAKDVYSDFKSPYNAEVDADYLSSWHYYLKRHSEMPNSTNGDPNKCYIFRLRTKIDEDGNIITCHYAKAYGDFPNLTYYFNPTENDTNLEFDPTQNLFKNLPIGGQISAP